jgi:hydrogenase-4 component B
MPFANNGEGVLIPLAAGVSVLIGLALTLAVVRLWFGRSRVKIDETWNCGTTIKSAMEYSGTSFSNPVLVILQRFVGTRRTVDIHRHYAYYPRRIRHSMETHYSIEDIFYRPTVGLTVKLAHKIRGIQNGNLQSYLAYMVLALIIALLWIRQVQV